MYEDDDFPRRQKQRSGGGGNSLLYLFLLVVIVGGIYYAWGGDFSTANTKRIMKGDFSSFGKVSFSTSTSTIKEGETLQEKGKKLVDSALEAAVEKPKAAITSFIKDVSKTAVDTARKEATQIFGISATGASALPSNVSIIRPAGQSISFVVGADTEDILYTIDWGDTLTASGTVPQKTEKTVSHAWAVVGDYLIVVETTGTESGKKVYSFPMSIQK
ncbi:MAG: hypothetical protein EXS60_00835 [Candidatus Pacebacteria bacterium]|nr:hypothetical protein [Candidatus Paceibacterota bacterium]